MGRKLVVGIVALVALVVVVGAVALWPRGTTAVTEDDALDDFREADTGEGGGGVPAAGVYRFAATGQERVQLGPLPAEDRPLPDEITAVAVDDGDGCFTWTLNLFAEHTEDTRFCVADDGSVTLDEHVKHQQIGAISPTATMTCDPGVLLAPDAEEVDLACTLELSGGPAAMTATLAGTATTGPSEEVAVGDASVDAVPVTVAYAITGDLTGSWTETIWFADDHLPVRIERDLALSGLANFTEQSTLELLDLEPSR